MSEPRYHISKSGKPVECSANKRTCPRGHYDSVQEAETAYLDQNTPVGLKERELFTQKCLQAGVTDPSQIVDHEGKSLLERWVEVASVREEQRPMSVDEFADDVLSGLDYGRHRGTWLVWHKNGEAFDSDDDEMEVSSENWDAQIAAGYVPVIQIHTRNGGGNRECYCDYDNHEEGCLSVKIEKMQEHPRYIDDQNDDWDRTYANFYYRLDPEKDYPRLKNLLDNKEQFHRVNRANATFQHLKDNSEATVYSVFPNNPAVTAKIAEVQAEQTAAFEETKNSLDYAKTVLRTNHVNSYSNYYSAELNEEAYKVLRAYRSGETVAEPKNRNDHLYNLKRLCWEMSESKKTVQKVEQENAELQKTITALREVNPELTDQLLSKLGPKTSTKQEWETKKASMFVTNNTSRLAKVYKTVSETKKVADKAAKLSDQLKKLREVQTVPGPVPKI